MIKVRLVDAHCHLHEFGDGAREFSDMLIVAVSDDLESSIRTLELAEEMSNVVPCVGVHPWEVGNLRPGELESLLRLVEEREVACLGEIGLDRIFCPETLEIQRRVFERLVALGREYGLVLNLHAAGAWREVLEVVENYDIERAIFHWYSGPLDVLGEIAERGYVITANPALTINKKHARAIEAADLDHILTESDGPYKYRGLDLNPRMVEGLVEKIARIKRTSVEQVVVRIRENARRLFGV